MQSSVYRFLLTDSDVGERVVLRRSLPQSPGPKQPPYGDVLGTLVAWADGVLTVRTADQYDSEICVEEATVVAGKRVPPRAARRGMTQRGATQRDTPPLGS